MVLVTEEVVEVVEEVDVCCCRNQPAGGVDFVA
jgi:hypothetical protein